MTPVEMPREDGAQTAHRGRDILESREHRLANYEAFYRDLHAHPELANEEVRTSKLMARELAASGFDVTTHIGGTGVVGVLENGPGPTVLLRADMDALPVLEETGLPYTSTATATRSDGSETPVMHACGHDLHSAALAATCDALGANRARWSGTILAVAQPAEETMSGARAMLDDGLYERFGVPDVALAQHVGIGPIGTYAHRAGPILTATRKVDATIHGSGGHGSMPHLSRDPVVAAAHVVTRLQGIVARRTRPGQLNVVTVGRLSAGQTANVIPESAVLQLSLRAETEEGLDQLVAMVDEIVRGECLASGITRAPEVVVVATGAATVNDVDVHRRVRSAHQALFGEEQMWDLPLPLPASEDFSFYSGRHLPAGPQVPTYFWFVGCMPRELWGDECGPNIDPPDSLPAGHSGRFAPAVGTLRQARDAMVTAALCYV